MRRVAALLGLAILTAGAATPNAAARSDAEGLLRVVEPAHGQGVFASGQPLRAVVRRGARLRVAVGGRDVTAAVGLRQLRRGPRARVLAGRLPQRLLRGGPKSVSFTARAGGRTDGDNVLLHTVARRPKFLGLRLVRRSGRAPAEAIVRTGRHRVWLRATLNGRRIEGLATSRRLRERRLRLTRTEGLRPGRNVLVVAANDERGRGDVERRVFRLPRRAVIAGVRAPRAVRGRSVVRLDAGPSFARGRGRLAYRWRIVRRPKGSRAKLSGARRRVARLRTDRPGRYSVRLVATRRAASAGRGARGPRAAAATVRGSVVTDVTAQAPIPPYGLPLALDPSKGLTLAGSTTPISGGTGGILVAAIDSATGAVRDTAQVPSSYWRDIDGLLETLGGYRDPGTIVAIVAGSAMPNEQWDTGSRFVELAVPLQQLGLDGDQANDAAIALVTGTPVALIGTPGDIAGSATVNVETGSLSGRLRLTGLSASLTGVLVFEQPDYLLFRLGGATDPTSVTGVNPAAGATPTNWIDQPLPPGDAMQVTVIDAHDLRTVASATGSAGGQNGAIAPVRKVLQDYAGDESKLILFKMDAPTAWENTRLDMSPISKALAAMGANRDVFIRSLRFPDSGDYGGNQYVFFGGAGVEPIEGSPAITAAKPGGGSVAISSPTLTGMMRRDRYGRWYPTAARANDKLTQPLQALATRAPVAFSYPSSPSGTRAQYGAAELKLFRLLVAADVVCTPGPNCGVPRGVRVNYANQELLGNLGAARAALKCAGGGVPADSGAAYSQAQLDALRAQVCGELAKLALVHDKLFGLLLTDVFPVLQSDSTLDLLSGSDTYLGFLEDERDRELAGRNEFLGISGAASVVLGDIFEAATTVADYVLAPETSGASIFGGAALADVLLLGGDSIGLASTVSGVGESADKVAPTMVTVGNLFSYIQSSFGYATARTAEVEALIVSDPTKLADAAAKVSDGSWDLEQPLNFEHQSYEAIVFQQRVAALRYMLPRMLSVDAKPCDTGGSADDPTTYEAWTQLQEIGPEENYLRPGPHRLRSVHLDSSDAQTLGSRLFAPPFATGTDPIAAGPASAALAPSPFFMREVAPTTASTSGDCSENFIP